MKFGARGGELHALPCVGAVGECARMRCCEMGDHGLARLRRPVNNQKRHVAGAGNITVKPGGARLVTVASTIRDGDVECRAGCRGTCRGEDGVKQTCGPCRIAHHIGLGLQCVKIVRHKDKSAVGRLRIQRDKRLTETALFTCARERMGREHDLRGAADKAASISVAACVGGDEKTRDRRMRRSPESRPKSLPSVMAEAWRPARLKPDADDSSAPLAVVMLPLAVSVPSAGLVVPPV